MPSNTTPYNLKKSYTGTTSSAVFYYTYVLESLKDHNRYIGHTNNLKRRLLEHSKGVNFSTKFRLPFKLIYFEGCLNIHDAMRREDYLKTTQGRRFLGLRLKEYQFSRKKFNSGS